MPERHGGQDGSEDRSQSSGPAETLDTPETEVIAAPDSWKMEVPEGTAGAAPSGPLKRLATDPDAYPIGRPADQRRLRDPVRRRGPDDPPEGGVG